MSTERVGLTTAQAEALYDEWGYNELPHIEISLWWVFFVQVRLVLMWSALTYAGGPHTSSHSSLPVRCVVHGPHALRAGGVLYHGFGVPGLDRFRNHCGDRHL